MRVLLHSQRCKRGHWRNEDNRKQLFDSLGEKLGIKTMDDWYKVSSEQIKANNASLFKSYYNGSLITALQEVYPHCNWNPLRFASVPQSYWKNIENQRNSLESIGKELRVKELDDWYNISAESVIKRASFITSHYNGSLITTLQTLYPHHNWNPFQFATLPRSFWRNRDNQRKGLELIGKQLGIKELDDWYNISVDQIKSKRRSSFIRFYGGSLITTLQTLYPHHNWDPLRFTRVPTGYWQEADTKKKYFDMFKSWQQQHNIKTLQDWYNLPSKNVKLFQRVAHRIHGTVTAMITEWFPETNWISQLHSSIPEQLLYNMMNSVAKDTKVHHKIDGYSVDIYIPSWNLALEYQGIQHFQQNWTGDFKRQQIRDSNKEKCLQEHNISLVPVNHQWNGSWSQLRATIRQHRPGTPTFCYVFAKFAQIYWRHKI